MKLYIERQNHLVVCKEVGTGHWFFSACYLGLAKETERRMRKGDAMECDLKFSNFKTVKRRK